MNMLAYYIQREAILETKQKIKAILISDGTGETGKQIIKAAMTQFADKDIFLTRYKNVRSTDQVSSILQTASLSYDLVIHTVVSHEIRSQILEECKKYHLRSIDLMGDLLQTFSNCFETEPSNKPGLLHEVNEQYFKRVEALEFTLNHDDGKNLASLDAADIILVGISRTSKTPLSIYLSLEGYKIVNIPMINGINLPEKIHSIDQKKIFGLTIDLDALYRIRQNRLERLGFSERPSDYADKNKLEDEINWANKIFNENKRWPIINVTEKAVEEIAAEIIKIIHMRSEKRFS